MTDPIPEELQQAAIRQAEQAAHQHDDAEVIRLLGGQAFLGGLVFRRRILHFFHKNYDAVAPEFGLDVRLLIQICLAGEQLQRRYRLVFAATSLLMLLGYLLDMPALIILGALVAAGANVSRANAASRHAQGFRRGDFNYAACVQQYGQQPIPKRIEDALPVAGQNLILYRGFIPFIGAGIQESGWSFNCALNAPRGENAKQSVTPFTATELYAHIKTALQAMQLPGLRCMDPVFVHGTQARGPEDLCSGPWQRPAQVIAAARLAQCLGTSERHMRHYLCVQIADWGGEIITTYYVRFVLRGNGLYVEFNRYFLGPVEDSYRKVDKLAKIRWQERLQRWLAACVLGPFMAFVATLLLLVDELSRFAEAFSMDRYVRERAEHIEYSASYNFGAGTSLREALSAPTWRHYFQRSDEDFNRKLIERKLLDELADFLEAHGYDSADIRERRTTILNNGIIVHGGNVQAEALAVGTGAKASKQDVAHAPAAA